MMTACAAAYQATCDRTHNLRPLHRPRKRVLI